MIKRVATGNRLLRRIRFTIIMLLKNIIIDTTLLVEKLLVNVYDTMSCHRQSLLRLIRFQIMLLKIIIIDTTLLVEILLINVYDKKSCHRQSPPQADTFSNHYDADTFLFGWIQRNATRLPHCRVCRPAHWHYWCLNTEKQRHPFPSQKFFPRVRASGRTKNKNMFSKRTAIPLDTRNKTLTAM